MILDKEVKIVSIGDLVMDINLSIQKLPIRVEERRCFAPSIREPGGWQFLIGRQGLGQRWVALGAVGDDFMGMRCFASLRWKA